MNIDHETKVEGQNQNYYSALSVNAVSFATSIPYQTTEFIFFVTIFQIFFR